MSTAPSNADRRYLDRLALELQLWHVPGERIGEILAEAEAHAAESGEPLREAFGEPRAYAVQWTSTARPSRLRRTVLTGATGAAGGFTSTFGAAGLATDQRLPLLGLPTWGLMVVGTALLVGWAALIPLDRIRDPRTGALRGLSRAAIVLIALAMSAVVAGAGAVGAALR